MEKNIYSAEYTQAVERGRSRKLTFSSLINKVYLWMTLALVVTGMTAFYVAGNEAWVFAILSSRTLFWGLCIAELAMVVILSSLIGRMSFAMAGVLFAAYSVLNGVTLSVIFVVYTFESIASTFFVTAGTFGAMSLIGMFTKKDLTPIGRFCYMALIGLIIATVVNIFVANSTFSWIITYAGVLIFCGLTAYDTQKMKLILRDQKRAGDTNALKIALLCSLTLYLDFINLFLDLLRIFGSAKK